MMKAVFSPTDSNFPEEKKRAADPEASGTTESARLSFPGLKIGVVASLKKGMEQFIYREVTHMERFGASITLFPTKQGQGLYEPKKSWRVVGWSLVGLLLTQPLRFFSRPGKYLQALMTAITYRSVGDFLLAAYFMNEMDRLDAIYATFGDRKFFVGYFGKRLTGKPLICTVHAYELYQNPNDRLFRKAIAACDQLITVSEYNRKMLYEKWGVLPEQVKIATYSIDLEDYQPAEKFVVLIVGFFVARKGHEILFRAVKALQNPQIEVWVVGGEGAESESVDVRKMANELGISEQVAFFGKQSGTALRALFHACDVFCLPCHFDGSGVGEGFPNVIIEAMATGKPVVSSRHVGIPEILEATCVDEHDCVGVAEAIDQLFRSPELRRQQGVRNRQLAKENFAPTNVLTTLSIAKQLAAQATMSQSSVKDV